MRQAIEAYRIVHITLGSSVAHDSDIDMNFNPGPSYGADTSDSSASTLHSSLSCLCGKTFNQQNALANHTRSCKSSKKRLASALDLAKDVWQRRKRKKEERLPEVESAMIEMDVVPTVIELPRVSSIFSVSYPKDIRVIE